MKAPGTKTLEYTGFAGPLFANLLTVVKLVNQIGADRLTPDAMLAAIKAFKGPMMLQVGPLDCGNLKVVGVAFPAVCPGEMGIVCYKDGKWVSIADGLNGKARNRPPARGRPRYNHLVLFRQFGAVVLFGAPMDSSVGQGTWAAAHVFSCGAAHGEGGERT